MTPVHQCKKSHKQKQIYSIKNWYIWKQNKQSSNQASKWAGWCYNAEILSEQIAKRLKNTDEGLKVTDSNGQLTVSSFEDLRNEFKSNERYSSLLRGNQSSGGGASGGNSGSATAEKTKSRADFDNMIPLKQMEFIKSGGAIFD